ncbi:multiple coagulation factor deficiency 2-like [Paramuricea clavata]|uniref:Multiple coagulation factor deficiency 2-like n=1 Tax=Paramuricea clavata TaxID=317549 RepID=A0A7D9HXP0_PARCT|nr:multiple coagulation factor deficiency 2-like [Paramuricea clavata]
MLKTVFGDLQSSISALPSESHCRYLLHSVVGHIQEHLNNEEEFPKDGQFAEDIQAIKNGDDTKGIFYFFELHDFDKNKKLDGLELFVALTDHHDKINTEQDDRELLEEEVESLIDNLLDEHDLNSDGYIDFTELMNTAPDSLWNKLGKV